MNQKMKKSRMTERITCAGCGMSAPKHLMMPRSGKFYCHTCAKTGTMR